MHIETPPKAPRRAKKSPPTMQPHEFRPRVRDLFGEVVVTTHDVRAWMLAVVPLVDVDGPRAAQYVRGYDVAGKVAAAKLEGTFDARLTPSPGRSLIFSQRVGFFSDNRI